MGRITRRDALLRLLGSAWALGSLRPRLASAVEPLHAQGAAWWPCDPCTLCPGQADDMAFAMLAIARGGWGFDYQTLSVAGSFYEVRELVDQRVIQIAVVTPESPCGHAADVILPSIPFGFSGGIQSGNPQRTDSITEGFRLFVNVDYAMCGDAVSPSYDSSFDYFFLITPSESPLVPQPFILFFPAQRRIVGCDGHRNMFEVSVDLDGLDCHALSDSLSVGHAQIAVSPWPALSEYANFIAVIASTGALIFVRPVNVLARCPGGDCGAEGSTFTLAVGQPYPTYYYLNPSHP